MTRLERPPCLLTHHQRVPTTSRSHVEAKGLRLLDIGRGGCAGPFAAAAGSWLALGCTAIDHVREFLVRTFEEGAELVETLLVLESSTSGDHEEATNFHGLSAQGENFIGNAPATSRAKAEETEAAPEGSAPAMPVMVV